MIQSELDEVKVEWNQHRTRASPNVVALPGKPDIMYFLPLIYGTYAFLIFLWVESKAARCQQLSPNILFSLFFADTHDYRIPVPLEDVSAVKEEFTTTPPPQGCSTAHIDYALR